MCQNNVFSLLYLCDSVKPQAFMIYVDVVSRKWLSILKDLRLHLERFSINPLREYQRLVSLTHFVFTSSSRLESELFFQLKADGFL